MEPTEAARQIELDEIEARLKENVSVIFLVHKKMNTTFHPSVRGVQLNARGWVDFKDVWFQHSHDMNRSRCS